MLLDESGAAPTPLPAAYDPVINWDISEEKQDQTVPNAPTVSALSSLSGDIDGDGSLDTGVQFTITAPGSGLTPKFYEVELWKAAAVGTSGSMTGYSLQKKRTFKAEDVLDTLDTLVQIECPSSKFYKVKVRCVSFAGKPGSFSAFQNLGFQPSGYSNTMPTVSWAASNPILAKPKSIVLKWQQISTTLTHAKEIVVYRNTSNNSATATEIATVPAFSQKYVDEEDLTIGTTYYFWLKVRDRANQVSTSFSTAQTATFRTGSAVASDTDFDTTALSAPGSPSYTQDTSFDLNGDGTVDMVMVFTWAAVTNAVDYEVIIYRCATLGGTYVATGLGGVTNTREWRHICNVNWYYKAQVRARNAYTQPGSLSTLTSAVKPVAKTAGPAVPSGTALGVALGIAYSWTAPAEADYRFTEFAVLSAPGTPTSSNVIGTTSTNDGVIYWPNPGNWFTYVRHVNQSGIPTAWTYIGTAAIDPITTIQIADGSVTYAKLDSTTINDGNAALALGDVGTYAFLKNGTGSTIAAGGTAAGSSLTYNDTGLSGTTAATGTWKALGRVVNGQATMFVRTV